MSKLPADMAPVETNRSYVKGKGACVNVDDQAYHTRLKRLKAEKKKNDEIQSLKNEIGELKSLVKELLNQGKE